MPRDIYVVTVSYTICPDDIQTLWVFMGLHIKENINVQEFVCDVLVSNYYIVFIISYKLQDNNTE